MSTNWETRTITVADLFLDEANTRIDLGAGPVSQDDLIQDLFINQGAYDLALSIAKNGLFQHELPIVVEDGKRLIVIEGNRRIAALRGIDQPDLIPSYAARLEQLRKTNKYTPVTSLDVRVAPNRAAAMQLLAAIHTTENRKPWAPLRQAYFYYAQIQSKSRTLKRLVTEYPNVDVPRFVRMWEMHRIARALKYDSPEEATKVASQQGFPITTLERIYDSEVFQKEFGVTFGPTGDAKITCDRKSFEEAFKKIIQDIVHRAVTSRTLNKSDELKKYLGGIPKPAASARVKVVGAKSFKPIPPPKAERKAKGLAPKDVTCSLALPGIKRVLIELQHLDYRQFPNAAHDLLRSFLECSLKAYFDHKGVSVPSKNGYNSLSAALSFAETYFATEKKALVQPIKVIRGSAGKAASNYLYSQDFLNAVNHNPGVFSTGDQVKEAWDQMDSIIRYILNP